MSTEDFWKGDFGDTYHARCRVDWRARIPFWREIMDLTGARSVYEFGCGPGWNLSAIKRAYPDVVVSGEDVNEAAADQALECGLSVFHVGGKPYGFELAFTAGVLIHIAPDDLKPMMQRVIDASCDYVLAIEYAADQEEEVEYRGHTGKLWRRPFGRLYQDMGLKLVMDAGAGPGFDDCTAILLRK